MAHDDLTRRNIMYCVRNRRAFEEKLRTDKAKQRDLKINIAELQDRLQIADSVTEVFEDCPISTTFRISAVEAGNTRYADHPRPSSLSRFKVEEEKWGFNYGNDYGVHTKAEWSGAVFETREAALYKAKRWVAEGVDPKEQLEEG